LNALLARLEAKRQVLSQKHGKHVPIALKVAPDLDDDGVQDIADAVRRHRFDAIIATNTTVSREGVEGLPHSAEAGGLSGTPVREKALAVQKKFHSLLKGEAAIIGVGGILSGEDAKAKIAAGANLVQLYTGLIYRGPGLVPECVNALR
jgi:dihydroorotate dehydrogenase